MAKPNFQLIACDVAWKYNARNNAKTRFGLGMNRYPGMTWREIMALPVRQIAADDAALFFWVTAPRIRPDYVPLKIMQQCFEAWGFRYVTLAFVWVKVDARGKQRILPGHYGASNVELCFLGIRGQMKVAEKLVPQVIKAPLDEHSRKPAEAQARMLRMFGDVKRLELFATEKKEGWSSWGHDVTGTKTLHQLFQLPQLPPITSALDLLFDFEDTRVLSSFLNNQLTGYKPPRLRAILRRMQQQIEKVNK